MNYLIKLVEKMKMKEKIKNNKKIIERISKEKSLTGKCILARFFLSPQSTEFETIIRNDLEINLPLNNNCGDGCKNGKKYEIKCSIHSKKSLVNFVQIRPCHNIDYYILVFYNMYKNDCIGKSYNPK